MKNTTIVLPTALVTELVNLLEGRIGNMLHTAGCNDLTIADTPENRAMLTMIEKEELADLGEDQEEIDLFDIADKVQGSNLLTDDTTVLSALTRRLEQSVGS